jgi:hypothetical protein
MGPATARDSVEGKDASAVPQVQVVGGGSNAVFIIHPYSQGVAGGSSPSSSDPPPLLQGKMAMVAKGEERCMVVGDIIEIDGFKRRNPKKFPEGPLTAYQLVALSGRGVPGDFEETGEI